MALLFAREMLIVWGTPDADLLDPFADANVYLAAGERLNAGHDLYALQAGDRPVLLMQNSTLPLYSPPAIAAIWRPLAAVPFGFVLWVGAAWVALLATIVYLVMRIGLPAAVVAAALSFPIGEQLVAGNLTAFFPALMVLMWRFRADPRVGAIVGVMAAFKIGPAALGGWVLGAHRVRGVAWVAAGAAVCGGIGVIGAGVASHAAYVGLIGTIDASGMSLSGITGIAWLSPAVLVVGTVIATFLWRMPRLSFVIAVVTLVVGSPALYLTTLTLFLGAMAPFIPETVSVTDRPRPVSLAA